LPDSARHEGVAQAPKQPTRKEYLSYEQKIKGCLYRIKTDILILFTQRCER
jgi:hypothetical protein